MQRLQGQSGPTGLGPRNTPPGPSHRQAQQAFVPQPLISGGHRHHVTDLSKKLSVPTSTVSLSATSPTLVTIATTQDGDSGLFSTSLGPISTLTCDRREFFWVRYDVIVDGRYLPVPGLQRRSRPTAAMC